jgi:hypothetical protein
MQWLAFLVKPILDFVYEKAVIGIQAIIAYFKEQKVRDKIEDEKMALAKEIEEIVKKMTAHTAMGEPVPTALQEQLREANRRLRNHIVD